MKITKKTGKVGGLTVHEGDDHVDHRWRPDGSDFS